MGGGDWINQRQEQQMMQLEDAYEQQYVETPPLIETANHIEMPASKTLSGTEVKMDGIDHAYVWMRTFTPSWLMGVFIVVGVLTIVPKMLERFGLEFDISLKKDRPKLSRESNQNDERIP